MLYYDATNPKYILLININKYLSVTPLKLVELCAVLQKCI